jgi:ABC-type sugar transport system substrate-binding protein
MRHRNSPLQGAVCGLVVVCMSLVGLAVTSSSTAGAQSSRHNRAASAVSKAEKQIAKYEQVPRFVAPDKPFSVKKLKGKTIGVVSITTTAPAIAQDTDSIKAAGKAAGVNVTVTNAKTTPGLMTQGIQHAISQHDGAIILVGIPANFVLSGVKQASKAGIPVVTMDDYQPVPSAKGQSTVPKTTRYDYGDADATLFLQGQLAADAAVVHWQGKVNAVIVNSAGLTQGPSIIKGYLNVLHKCSTCHILATTNVEIPTWFTKLAPLAGSLVKQYPTMNTIMPIFNDMVSLMVPAVKTDGDAGKVIVEGVGGGIITLVPAYPTIWVDFVGSSNFWTGWAATNQALRAMLKLKPANPIGGRPRVVTPQTAGAEPTAGKKDGALFGLSYTRDFKKLWKVSK